MRRALSFTLAILSVVALASIPTRAAATTYQVGAASRRIDPDADPNRTYPRDVRQGGFGLGDGTVIPDEIIGPGGKNHDQGDHISARAVVVSDGTTPIALVTVETQGMFAAYQRGLPGLLDIEQAASARTGIPAANIVISNNHTHSGPDLIGAWGFVPDDYVRFIAKQTEDAIVAAWDARADATIVAGADFAPDLIYNMTCTEALNQGQNDTYPNTICNPGQDQKDSWLRVFQARAVTDGSVITTVLSYAAHATLGGGAGLHGDWPQFMSDRLTAEYGGVGIAFQGAIGRTQPCRPRCGFTDKTTPGYEIPDRKTAYTTMLLHHVERALTGAPPLNGNVKASKTFIRHQVTNPALFALVTQGSAVGAPIQRSLDAPWTVGNTVRTVVSAIKMGSLLINGHPGESYPNIPAGIAEATNVPLARKWTLGLADDQLGYLIAPVEAYPLVLAESAVNDNAFFNIDAGIGDHVMCAAIRLAGSVGFSPVRIDPHCPAWDAVDAAGDPLG